MQPIFKKDIIYVQMELGGQSLHGLTVDKELLIVIFMHKESIQMEILYGAITV
jgi:hypothetical protein